MNDDTFKGAIIDDEEHQAELKSRNFIPKGVRTLEWMFDLDNKSAATFFALGIEEILNAWKFINKSHTSFW